MAAAVGFAYRALDAAVVRRGPHAHRKASGGLAVGVGVAPRLGVALAAIIIDAADQQVMAIGGAEAAANRGQSLPAACRAPRHAPEQTAPEEASAELNGNDGVTKIIAGFPGVGKSHFFKRSSSTGNDPLDSDSSKFSWMMTSEGKVRHPDWPNNYMDHIKANFGKAPLIMVSTHKEVRDALVANKLPFTLVYPSLEIRDEYIQRYIARGDNDAFVRLLEQHYDAWIRELMAQNYCAHVALRPGQYLSDVVDQL